jgi:hypothetical protein
MKDILHWARKRSGLNIDCHQTRREKSSVSPHGERRWMSSEGGEDRNGAFIIGYSRKSGTRGNCRTFWWSLVGCDVFCHPHFRGLLNDPRSQPHAKPARPHIRHLPHWMRWLHRIRLFFYLSTHSILWRAGFSILTTVDSELRLHLLSLHVARLTNLVNPLTTNWRNRQATPKYWPCCA